MGRSTTHILCSICIHSCFGESCRPTIVHGITSQPANVFSNVPYSHFGRSPVVWLKLNRKLFDPPVLEVKGVWGSRMGQFVSPPAGSYLLPVDTYMVYLCPFFSYLAGSKSIGLCPPARTRPSDTAITYRSIAIASSNGKNVTTVAATTRTRINETRIRLGGYRERRSEVIKMAFRSSAHLANGLTHACDAATKWRDRRHFFGKRSAAKGRFELTESLTHRLVSVNGTPLT